MFSVFFYYLLSFLVDSDKQQWNAFKTEFNKSYDSIDDARRFNIFKENINNIQNHNIKFKNGEVTYEQDINRFADLTDDEFTAYYGLYNRSVPIKYYRNATINEPKSSDNSTDDFLDWRISGGITPPKDQGQCGSCYVFSAMANIEYHQFLETGQLISFSEQYVIDCFNSFYKGANNNSCGGGFPVNVFIFAYSHGIHLESNYPYVGKQNACQNISEPASNVSYSELEIVMGSDETIKEGLKQHGPLTTCFAVSADWRFYKSGVWYHDECAQASNHCVLVVGYGSENGNDYWLIKNSWGPDWGDNGYIKIARNVHENYCGFKSGLYLIDENE
ncbi:unnamed protein product [Phyllotreta striolata]|uniref:Uncharacterized protein n=1 Tax=Phyllotreta striolata TaxID=444603 RepID=A0A9N9TKN5_PHYSR|nr:unnamed protein product [Phyllotreta striolata]